MAKTEKLLDKLRITPPRGQGAIELSIPRANLEIYQTVAAGTEGIDVVPVGQQTDSEGEPLPEDFVKIAIRKHPSVIDFGDFLRAVGDKTIEADANS